ncbi:hypothetical protein Xen7305DRAFT_00046560 [Xenococcus sp. PCC 7305]|nr:hypothetical protein Xen7305DRAFT_00046560 [Xenococcus sp. PCC 7305]
MKLIIYPLLSTCSKRAIRKVKKKWGHPNYYEPRITLVKRLSATLGWSEDKVRQQISEERYFLIEHDQYFS